MYYGNLAYLNFSFCRDGAMNVLSLCIRYRTSVGPLLPELGSCSVTRGRVWRSARARAPLDELGCEDGPSEQSSAVHGTPGTERPVRN